MSIKREEMPLSSFDPRYKTIILKGARERVEFRQKTKREAQRLRHILTTFRARMRKQWRGKDDSQWEPLYGAIIGLSADGYATVIRPRLEEADKLLGNMKIEADIDTGLDGTAQPAPDAPHLDSDPLAEFTPDKSS